MLTIAGFLTPYFVAVVAYPLLVRLSAFLSIETLGTCLLIVVSPWLIPAEFSMLRFLASISAAMLTFKVIDVSLDLKQQRKVTWQDYIGFLFNPFTLVRRSLSNERRPFAQENLRGLLRASIGCTVALFILWGLFRLDWSNVPFLVEHAGKVTALMLAIACGLSSAAAIWRLFGGTARDFMDKPFIAKTPAEFWRRYNRNVQQFFWLNIFSDKCARRRPIRTMIFVFGLSALLHEWIFLAAVGALQGYQITFFALQGLAAASTARIKVRGKFVVPCVVGTLAFNLLTSVLFFASIHSVTPFYSQGLPVWLLGW